MEDRFEYLGSEQLRKHPIVFFDGVCNLCNRSVDFVLRVDRRRVFRFASLQGETARLAESRLPVREPDAGSWSMVLLDDSGCYERSEAALRVMKKLGGGAGFLGCLGLCVPKFLRDGVYRIIARKRYDWFGRKESCRLPSLEEQAVFLP
tara:strand:- start:25 stop:471 length:447 start_codon:yes stop_codon:yes gene_type:complete